MSGAPGTVKRTQPFMQRQKPPVASAQTQAAAYDERSAKLAHRFGAARVTVS